MVFLRHIFPHCLLSMHEVPSWKPCLLHLLFLFSHCWIASFQQTDLFSHLNAHFIFHSRCVILHELFLLITHLINQVIYIFPAILYLSVERCAHFFKECDEPHWDVKSLHISSAPVNTFAIGCLLLCWLHCSFLYLMTLICGAAGWLPVPLSQQCLSCAGAHRAALSCCSLHSFAAAPLVHSDPVWATLQTSQATALWVFHISLHTAFILCSPLVPNWFSDHASALCQAVCLWVPKNFLQKISAAQSYSCFDFLLHVSHCVLWLVHSVWSIHLPRDF